MNKKKTVIIAVKALTLRVISAIFLLLFFMFVTRNLTQDQSGVFFLSFVFISIISAVGSLGLNRIVARIIAGHSHNEEKCIRQYVIGRVLSWVLFSSVVLAILVYLLSDILAGYVFSKVELGGVLSVMSLSIVPITLYLLLGNILEGLGKPLSAIFTLNLFSPLGSLLIGIVFFAFFGVDNNIQVAWFFLGGSIITLALGSVFVYQAIGDKNMLKGSDIIYYNNRQIIDAALPMLVVLLMSHAIRWSSQIATGVWLPASDVASISVATRIAASIGLVLQAISRIVSPRFAYLHKNKRSKEIWPALMYSLHLSLLFSLPIIIIIISFSKFFMSLFGAVYSEYWYILVILSIGYFINAVTGPVAQLLVMVEKEKLLRNITIFSGAGAIILSLALTPLYGILGAAIAATIVLITQNIILLFWVKKLYQKEM